jgi:ribosomal protein S18 acetylase RimI-like enzyme
MAMSGSTTISMMPTSGWTRRSTASAGWAFAFSEIRRGEFKLDKLYIHPDVQRKGVGGQLIDHVAARAKKLGYPCVILAVNKRNAKAIGSYKKYGFVVRERSSTTSVAATSWMIT